MKKMRHNLFLVCLLVLCTTICHAENITTTHVFGEMYKRGYIYKGLKPVYWCPHDETALAEAEIEYKDDTCTSIFVKFRVKDDKGLLDGVCEKDNTYFVIWTTTTWTLPANLAVCFGPKYDYVLIKANGEFYVMAEELAAGVMKAGKVEEYEILGRFTGKAVLDDGTIVEVRDFPGFAEKVENKW